MLWGLCLVRFSHPLGRRRNRTVSWSEPDFSSLMGGVVSVSAPNFPTSTPSLCVLPLRTNGQVRFSVAPGPMPSLLITRLRETEWQVLVDDINTELIPLSHFGFMSLLLPFLVVDLLTIVLLCAIDPWLLVSPWEYGFHELLLPILLEMMLVFCGFPLIVHVVNRRMAIVHTRVRKLLDAASCQFGSRNVNFQMKQVQFYHFVVSYMHLLDR